MPDDTTRTTTDDRSEGGDDAPDGRDQSDGPAGSDAKRRRTRSPREATASEDRATVPAAAKEVAERYHRTERLARAGLLVPLVPVLLAVMAVLPLFPTTAVLALVFVGFVVPIFRTDGQARLRTQESPETVRADFEGPTPPPLALQWGVADDVRRTEEGGEFDLSYLLGLRTVTMRHRVVEPTGETAIEDPDLRLEVTVGDDHWGTYDASIREDGDATVVEYGILSSQPFGLNQIQQYLLGQRYRASAWRAQGYEVLERDSGIRFGR